MTRACDVSSCPRPQHARTPSDRVPTPQAPDAVQLSPDAQPKTALLPQHHNSYVFVRSWIAQHAGPCAESHSSTPSHTPLNNHRSVSHPLPAATTENFHQPYAQALHSRLDHALSADVDGLSDAFPHNPLPPPSACSANSAHGEPSSQCSINSMHSYPSYQYLKSKAHQSAYCQRAAPPHSHSPSLTHAHTVAAPTGPGYPSSFFFPVHPTAKQSGPRNHPRTRSYSGSPFSQNGMHHVQSNSNAASWRSGGQAQPPPVPPPPHGRPVVNFQARHLSSPPCLPQPPPPALPEGYSAPQRHSGRQRTVHYSHPNHQSHSSHDHIPGPPPLPEAMAVSSWGHRPPPPRSWQPSARVVPPPPPPVASAGLPSTSQPGSLLASPQPDPLAAPLREAAAAPVSQPAPQTPPHERPHSDLERFLQAVDRLWAAPPPPPPAADSTSAPSCSHDHLDGGAGHCCQPASDPASPSDRGCCHRPCNPMGNSNGSEGNDTLDSGLPEGSGSRQPAPATLADVWSRVEDCSAFGLEVTCAAKGSVSCSYFVPHLSALHIVATAPQDDAPGALDTLFDDGESTAPPEALRGGRMNEEGTDEAATDGTAEESGADAHTHSGDADTVPSPVAGGMDMDTSGFLHSGAPSTSRGSVMHDACYHTDTSHTERCALRTNLNDLPAVFSSRVDDPAMSSSPRLLAQPTGKASLRLVANWAAEGPTWERPPMFLHIQELCGTAAKAAGASGHASPMQTASSVTPSSTAAARGVAGSTPPSARVAGIPCPASLSSTQLRNIHPTSWFAILWHPLCRIPDSDLRARFITYHEVGCAGADPLPQHGAGSTAAAAGGQSAGAGSTLSGSSALGPPPATGIQGAPRLVGALVDIGDDGGNWLAPTLVAPDGSVHQVSAGDERKNMVAMLRGAADALSRASLYAEMADGPQALPFVHHDHKLQKPAQA